MGRTLCALALLGALSGCWQATTQAGPRTAMLLASDPSAPGQVLDSEVVGFLFWGLWPLRSPDLTAVGRGPAGQAWRDVRVEFRATPTDVAFSLLTFGLYTQRTLVVMGR